MRRRKKTEKSTKAAQDALVIGRKRLAEIRKETGIRQFDSKPKQPVIDLLTGLIYAGVRECIEAEGKIIYYNGKKKGRFIRYIKDLDYTQAVEDYQNSQTSDLRSSEGDFNTTSQQEQ